MEKIWAFVVLVFSSLGDIIMATKVPKEFPKIGSLVKVSARGPARGGPALADASRGLCAMGFLL